MSAIVSCRLLGDEYDNKNKMRVFRRRPRARVRLDDFISLSTPKNRRASIRHSLNKWKTILKEGYLWKRHEHLVCEVRANLLCEC